MLEPTTIFELLFATMCVLSIADIRESMRMFKSVSELSDSLDKFHEEYERLHAENMALKEIVLTSLHKRKEEE